MKSDLIKLIIAIILDLADFTIGRMLGVGMIFDVALAAIAYIMWGPIGLVQLWEVADPSEQIDGFVPTMTLIALSQLGRRKKKSIPDERP